MCIISAQGDTESESCHDELSPLIKEFANLFEAPKELPPKRLMDHKISIKPGVLPIKQHAYRYPLLQRKKIEKLVQEMLQTRVIRPSCSPYSSPVLLVKKKDGS